jgi:micrococcal nuclease
MKRWMTYLLLALMVLLSLTPLAQSKTTREPVQKLIHATITDVHDGDTVTALVDPLTVLHVRLLGIDAPELKQAPWGVKSRDTLKALVMGKLVAIIVMDADHPTDVYGRTLAYLWVGSTMVQEQLVLAGMAQTKLYGKAPKDFQRLVAAEAMAKAAHAGLWSDEAFIAPSDWRKQHHVGKAGAGR